MVFRMVYLQITDQNKVIFSKEIQFETSDIYSDVIFGHLPSSLDKLPLQGGAWDNSTAVKH